MIRLPSARAAEDGHDPDLDELCELWMLVQLRWNDRCELATLTMIGSMSNGQFAAILWQHGVLFAGIMAFLSFDFAVSPPLRINATNHGWRFAALHSVFAVAGDIANIMRHLLFAMLGLTPKPTGTVEQMVPVAVDYAFFLNLLAPTVAILLLWMSK